MAPDIVDTALVTNQSDSGDTKSMSATNQIKAAATVNGLYRRVHTTSMDDSTGEACDTTFNNINCDKNDNIIKEEPPFKPNIRWPDLVVQIFLHTGALYGFLFLFWSIKIYTFLWCKYNKHWF